MQKGREMEVGVAKECPWKGANKAGDELPIGLMNMYFI